MMATPLQLALGHQAVARRCAPRPRATARTDRSCARRRPSRPRKFSASSGILPGAHRRDGRDVLLGERAHDEAGAVLDGAGGRHLRPHGRHVVDAQARPCRRLQLEIRGDEAIAHGHADRFGSAGQRQQQSDLIGKFGGGGDLALRGHEHAVVGRMLRIGALPAGERRGGVHRVARSSRPPPAPAPASRRPPGRSWAAPSGTPRSAAARSQAEQFLAARAHAAGSGR